jgi:hypothetical protein
MEQLYYHVEIHSQLLLHFRHTDFFMRSCSCMFMVSAIASEEISNGRTGGKVPNGSHDQGLVKCSCWLLLVSAP